MKKTGSGFYSNWDVIEQNSRLNNILYLSFDDSIIGFASWRKYDEIVKIDFLEIKKEYRGRGFGRYLVKYLLEELLNQGCLACRLVCSPVSSDAFWEKLGFDKYEARNTVIVERYKYLKHLKSDRASDISKENEIIHKIGLRQWDDEYLYSKGLNEKNKWEFDYDKGIHEIDPIFIIPSNPEWFMEMIIDENEVLYRGQVKYCDIAIYKKSGFLILTKEKFEDRIKK